MISFIVSRFSLTDPSMLVLPVLSISFINDNGSSTAKGMFFLISSATFGGNLFVCVRCRNQEINLVGDRTNSVADWIGGFPPSLNDTSGYDRILFRIDSNA